jgi:ribosome-associated protein
MYTKSRQILRSFSGRLQKDAGIAPHFVQRMSPLQTPLKSMTTINFLLRGEYIPLDALLKATGLAPSGGLAKAFVAQGQVQVNGALELRKTCKIRAGQVVTMGPARVHVLAAPDAAAGDVE